MSWSASAVRKSSKGTFGLLSISEVTGSFNMHNILATETLRGRPNVSKRDAKYKTLDIPFKVILYTTLMCKGECLALFTGIRTTCDPFTKCD